MLLFRRAPFTAVVLLAACGGSPEGGSEPGTPSPDTEVTPTGDPEALALFELSAPFHGVTARATTALRLSAGPESAPVRVHLSVPAELSSAPSVAVFVQVYEGHEEELHDVFVPLPTARSGGQVSAEVPPAAFRARDGSSVRSALLMLAAAPALASSAGGLLASTSAGGLVGDGCPAGASHVSAPLAETAVQSGFSTTRSNAMVGIETNGHPATDFVADDVPVFSQGPGTVIEVRDSTMDYDPGWDKATRITNGVKDNGGFGGTVVVRADGGGTLRYAHLKRGSILVSVGQHVGCRQQLATSGNTGASTGPHLHVEYSAPKLGRVDPAACIDLGYQGTIDVDSRGGQVYRARGEVQLDLCLEDRGGRYYNMTGTFYLLTSITGPQDTCTLATTRGPVADNDGGSTTDLQLYKDAAGSFQRYDLDFGAYWTSSSRCVAQDGRTYERPSAFALIFATLGAGCGAEQQLPVRDAKLIKDTYSIGCNGFDETLSWELRKRTR